MVLMWSGKRNIFVSLMNNMDNLTPENLNQWVTVLWSAGWKVLLVFVIIIYRDLVIHTGKTIVDVFASWIKKK